MSLSTYIIDDEMHSIEFLTNYIHRTPGLDLSGSALNPLTAIATFGRHGLPDILFLDIDMPGLTGLEIAKLYQGKSQIIFTTSHRKFGPEAFELSAVDYLLKPYAYVRFLEAIEKIRGNRRPASGNPQSASDLFYVKTGIKGNLLKINTSAIMYIKSDRNYADIHLPDRVITAYLTLSDICFRLPAALFPRVHRSYIVSLDKIKAIEPGQILLENGERIDLGKKYQPELMNLLGGQILISQREQNHFI